KKLLKSQLRKKLLKSQLRKKMNKIRVTNYQPLFLRRGYSWSDIDAFLVQVESNPNAGNLAGVH
ncbi:MAG: hypothetical protein CME14_02895, partial [Gemmatimonadetes bacterium]|nr:hypothetical protein [Gemmatimonadota bacterium]